jgi:spermidine/putrescine transport system substrate-binding protein
MARNLDEILQGVAQTQVSRRRFMAAAGLAATSGVLAACTTGDASGAPTAAPTSGGGGASAAPTNAPTAAPTAAPTFPPPGEVEKVLFLYDWSDYLDPQNIKDFKAEFGVEKFKVDSYASNDELVAKVQAGATGYDIGVPTADYVPGLAEGGYLQRLDWSRIPNAQYINPVFRGLAWDPNDEWLVPKHFGTTGILWRSQFVTEPVTSWQDFFELATGKYSGKIVIVDSMGDVFPMPLKMLGYSVNTEDEAEMEAAREILLDLAPHVLALDSDTYEDKLANREALLALGWAGEVKRLRKKLAAPDTMYVVPSEGSIFWLDSYVLFKDAPNPNAAYAFLNYIHEPERAAVEADYNGYGTPNEEAKKYIPADVLADETLYPSEDAMKNLEVTVDLSGNQQRVDIWQEFKSRIGG